ncbi:MAG TPA: DHA2 family efflux MFS transporter permease subunit [Pseudonocardia sp.]|nr:DHA2 family efflux MFS transporter permease subunit [Pseudonocardia sp.]
MSMSVGERTRKPAQAPLRGHEPVADPARPQPVPPRPTPPPPAPPVRPAVPDNEGPRQNWGLPLAVVVIGMFMSVLDTSIVNVAIPTMQTQFGVTTDDIEWITTAYTLCLGVVVPTSAWLGERLGLRRMYLLSLLSFAAFSALCGMAADLNQMIAFRILQAIPGGMIPVTCLTILYKMVPKQKLGAAMGLYGFGIVVAPGIGPTLGGYLVEYVNWRLIFYINVPVGLLGAVAAMAVLPAFAGSKGRRFDVPGFICIGAGLFCFLLALSEGQTWGWTSYPVLILLAVGINLLLLFAAIELAVPQPLLDVRVFTSWPFINSLLLISINSVGLFAVLFYVPLFLQQSQHLTPWHTGLTVLPQAVAMAAIMPFAGRIYDRFGARWPAIIGLGLSGTGTLLLSNINVDVTRGDFMLWMAIRAGGLGLCMMPIMTAGISSLPSSRVGSGSAFNNLTQRVTSALGLALITGIATSQKAQFMADRSGLLRPDGANANPELTRMAAHGPEGMLPLWQQLSVEVQAQAYSNVFLITGALTFIGMALAFCLRSGKPSGAESEEAAAIEV